MKRRNTNAFTFLAWVSFVAAVLAMYVGIYYLKEPLMVKPSLSCLLLYYKRLYETMMKIPKKKDDLKNNKGPALFLNRKGAGFFFTVFYKKV
jgi:hypothetical protein